jgi:DNA-binding NtrC family response regulator
MADVIERKSKPTVLVVDDDSSVRQSICRVLAAEPLQVVAARDVKDALDHIERNTPDLVITDLHMGTLSGWDLIIHLEDRYPRLPIFVITALPLQYAGKATRNLPVVFQKPLDLDRLLAAIRRQLGAPGPSDSSSHAPS